MFVLHDLALFGCKIILIDFDVIYLFNIYLFCLNISSVDTV